MRRLCPQTFITLLPKSISFIVRYTNPVILPNSYGLQIYKINFLGLIEAWVFCLTLRA